MGSYAIVKWKKLSPTRFLIYVKSNEKFSKLKAYRFQETLTLKSSFTTLRTTFVTVLFT
jgi:hypothetical protein